MPPLVPIELKESAVICEIEPAIRILGNTPVLVFSLVFTGLEITDRRQYLAG